MLLKGSPNHKNILCWPICYRGHETRLAEHIVQALAAVRCAPSTRRRGKACISSLAALQMQLAVQIAPSHSGRHRCKFHHRQHCSYFIRPLTICATVLFVICSILAFLIFSFSSSQISELERKRKYCSAGWWHSAAKLDLRAFWRWWLDGARCIVANASTSRSAVHV